MGNSLVQWRSAIGSFAGGNKRSTCTHFSPNYTLLLPNMHINLVVIFSLLIIGCVELNPGPDTITLSLEDTVKKNNEALNTLLAGQATLLTAITTLTTKVTSLETKIGAVSTDLEVAKADIRKLKDSDKFLMNVFDRVENLSRKDNAIIFGLKETDANENSLDTLCTFSSEKLDYELSLDNIVSCFRVGKRLGKRPLLVSFINQKIKRDFMKNVKNLAGTGLSVSDDLTPTARSNKKLILKSAKQARELNFQVKVRSDHLVVNGTTVPVNELSRASWFKKFMSVSSDDDNASTDGTDNQPERPKRKRPRPQTRRPEVENPQSNDVPFFDFQVPTTSGLNLGNRDPLSLQRDTGGGGAKTRSRSNSRGSQNVKT